MLRVNRSTIGRCGSCDSSGPIGHDRRITEHPVRFAGTLPGDADGSPLPGLQRSAGYLRRADPDALPCSTGRSPRSAPITMRLRMRSLHNYTTTDQSAQDTLTATLSRLLGRMESMIARRTVDGEDAMSRLRGAWHVDHLHRDMAGLGLAVGTASLDAFMADSVLRRLEREPDARIVLALHNAHIRTTPVEHNGPSGLFLVGYHLRNALGNDYLAIAATGKHGQSTTGAPNADEPSGLELTERDLPEPNRIASGRRSRARRH